ncbi:MAG: hypothetical protein LC109_12660 [Bacteroidia bacterium]|nr:hypothetical protein [Bacteroidia bacterium]
MSVFIYLFMFATMGFFIWLSEQGNKVFYGTLATLIIIFLGVTLPFHYVPSRGKVFAKENLTFSNTIILESDISDLIKRYNDASIFEKAAINNEPLNRKLMQEHIIIEKNTKSEEEN